jgi:hypothetical protein
MRKNLSQRLVLLDKSRFHIEQRDGPKGGQRCKTGTFHDAAVYAVQLQKSISCPDV